MITNKIIEQIKSIRDTALSNMFDLPRVLEIAELMGYDELIKYIEKDKGSYSKFIITGEK